MNKKSVIVLILLVIVMPISYAYEEKTYIYGNGLIASKDDNNQIVYYHQDFLGSNRFTTNMYGELIGKSVQEPYGNDFSDKGKKEALENKYKFTGKEKDDELYYFGARYYEPSSGRFISVDPAFSSSVSPYAYANGNPLKFVDPSGSQNIVATRDPSSQLIVFPEIVIEHPKMSQRELQKMFRGSLDIWDIFDWIFSSKHGPLSVDLEANTLNAYMSTMQFPVFSSSIPTIRQHFQSLSIRPSSFRVRFDDEVRLPIDVPIISLVVVMSSEFKVDILSREKINSDVVGYAIRFNQQGTMDIRPGNIGSRLVLGTLSIFTSRADLPDVKGAHYAILLGGLYSALLNQRGGIMEIRNYEMKKVSLEDMPQAYQESFNRLLDVIHKDIEGD